MASTATYRSQVLEQSKAQGQKLFEPASFYLVRCAILPFDRKESYTQQDAIELFKKNSLIREAILIASPDLYFAAKSYENKPRKQQIQIEKSLLKYLLRMTTRSTPFGLFSFTATGHWDNQAQGSIDQEHINTRVRPDMKWLMQIIDRISSDERNLQHLPLLANPLIKIIRDRIYLDYTRKNKKKISVKLNPLTQVIVDICKHKLTVNELIKAINSTFPGIDVVKVTEVIQKLLDEEILSSGLLPNLSSGNPLNDLIENIDKYQLVVDEYQLLIQLQSKILAYQKLPLTSNDREEKLAGLIRLMQTLAKSSVTLQVDAYVNKSVLTLPTKIANEISDSVTAAFLINSMTQKNIDHPLQAYQDRFLEKYGYSRIVPLVQLLDEHELGLPKPYEQFQSLPEKEEPEIVKWLNAQWVRCVNNQEREVVISKKVLEKFNSNALNLSDALPSLDLFCTIVAPSIDHINQGNYRIHCISATGQAASVFGRFFSTLPSKDQDGIKRLLQREEELQKPLQIADLSYFPEKMRSANVAISPNLRRHLLACDQPINNSSIQLKDIYVGVDTQGFYFTDAKGEKRYSFSALNVVAVQLAPPVLRFLRDVSLFRHHILGFDYWGKQAQAFFLPRIRYKNTILSLAKWNINQWMLDLQNGDQLADIVSKLKNYLTNIDRYVYMLYGDTRVLVDTYCDQHIELMAKQVRDHRLVQVEEAFPDELGWLPSNKGLHCMELVLPMLKNPMYFKKISTPIVTNCFSSDEKRFQLLGSDWIFLNIYLDSDEQNRFLLQSLMPFAQQLQVEGIITGWFFIRYKDSSDHLRVRFQGPSDHLLKKGIPELSTWLKQLLTKKYIQTFNISPFEREVERYGGIDLIDAIEAFFCADSDVVLSLLQLEIANIPEHVIAAVSLFHMVELANVSGIDNRSLNAALSASKTGLEGIREHKNALQSLCLGCNEGEIAQVRQKIFSALKIRQKAFCECLEKMLSIEKQKQLTTSISSILNSLMHMHCNRLLGINHQLEEKARSYADWAMRYKLKFC